MNCRVCHEPVISDDNIHWTHEHGDESCGTGDGSVAYPVVEPIEASGADIDAMVRGYLVCQLWAGLDLGRSACHCHEDCDSGACENPTLDANYTVDDISPEYVAKVRDELTEVVAQHPLAVRMYLALRTSALGNRVGYDSSLFGHDFYLTREGHGAGFWDRGLGELGDYLTDIAKSYGSADQLWDNGEGVLNS